MPPVIRAATTPRPLQFTPMRKEQFASDDGVSFFNQTIAQMINAINRQSGQAGPMVIPAGIDVAGGRLTGLAAPTDPSDAVSVAHADANYSPAVASPALDIGGKNALKGLTSLFLKVGQVQAGLPNNYTGGGAVNLFGLVIQFGLISDMDSAVFPMSFPAEFPNACQAIIASTIGDTDRITYVVTPALPSLPLSKTQFTLANNGSGVGACWIAMGW